MENSIINFDKFDLPFSSESTEVEDNDETSESDSEMEDDEELDASDGKEKMEAIIPKEAIFIGGIDSEEVENWTTWSIQHDYYIIPLNDTKYNWALFRIRWDDNWGTWNWSFDARLSGYRSNYKEAAKYMLLRLWERWELDLNDTDNEPYINLINEI